MRKSASSSYRFIVKLTWLYGLITVAASFMVQNFVIVILWFHLYNIGPSIKAIVDAAAPYLFVIILAQTIGLSVIVWINTK